MKRLGNTWILVLLVAVGGCDPTKPATSPSGTTASQRAMGNAIGMNLDTSGPVGGSSAPASTPAPAVESAPAAPAELAPAVAAPTQPATEQVKAEAGVGVKGQSLQEHSGPIVDAAKAFIRVEQRVVFEQQIPKAMQLFEATEGRKPNSEQEFMTKIIAGNNINLPKLRPGEKYVYNVEKGELMVQKPAN